MVHFFPGWGTPQPHSGQQASGYSPFTETVIAVALSALAFFTANAFDRTNPGLATLMRLGGVGVGLIWLFNRCCSSSTPGTPHVVHHHVPPPPVYVPPQSPPPYSGSFWNRFSLPTMHPAPATRAYAPPVAPHYPNVHPTHAPGGGFPSVHRAPPQPDPRPMHQAPSSRHPAFNSDPPPPYGHRSQSEHPGNQRQLFSAAKTR